MKRLIYILFLSIPFFVSCSEELFHEHDGERENCIVLSVQNSSMKTKADDSNVENLIKTLDLFFYPSNATEANSVYTKHYDFNKVVSGQENLHIYITDAEFASIFPNNNIHTCVVYAIANFPGTVPTADTKLSSLKQYVITATDDNAFVDQYGYPCVPSSFIMYGEQTLTRADATAKTVSGHLPMYRTASKITLKVNLPNSIHIPLHDENGDPVLDADGNPVKEEWFPVFDDDEPENGMSNLYLGFHKGLKKGYIDGRLAYPAKADDFFETEEVNDFDYVGEAEYNGVTYNSFACDATFLSFSRMWGQGDVDAPYFILSVPWRRTKTELDNSGNIVGEWLYQTYYYQVQVNPLGRVLTSNHWYDLTLNVGILGSTVKNEPELLNNCTYFVIDWSHLETISEGNHEEIHLDEWRYLVIDQNRIEMNNNTVASLPFKASHDIKWSVEWPTGRNEVISNFDNLENFYNNKDGARFAAFYINSQPTNALAVDVHSDTQINDNSFDRNGSTLIFTCPNSITNQATSNIYSPVYVYLKVWLNINDDGDNDNVPNGEETQFINYVTFIYYPSMYVVPDPSTLKSIYINGENGKDITSQNLFNNTMVKIGSHNLGSPAGVRNYNSTAEATTNYSMYVITVTSFDGLEEFQAPKLDGEYFSNFGYNTQEFDNYKYIIGDPRSRSKDNELDEDEQNDVSGNWAKAPRVVYLNDGTKTYVSDKGLTDYYPTMSSGKALQIVAPKFRIVSFNNASTSNVTPYGAAMRCASLQEDGFPAGRWRLPTIAEIQYVIDLQNKEVIAPVFTAGNNNWGSRYYASSFVNSSNRSRVAIQLHSDKRVRYRRIGPDTGNNISESQRDHYASGSVRCVYDEWYWGAARDAKINEGDTFTYQGETADYYLFTWGDREIIW